MGASPMPAAEVVIDEDLVRALVRAQFPQWAGRPVRIVESPGWDNVIARLGDDLVARLPRRSAAAGLVEKEQRWLPALAAGLPLPVPVPLGCGVPGEGYPWRWSVCPWLPGEMAAVVSPAPGGAAEALGRFVAALGRPAPPDAPRSPIRGIPLAARDVRTREDLAALATALPGRELAALGRLWDEALDAPARTGPDVWVHGDLHPANLLVRDGRLGAVLDFGDLCAGDPATDLISGWMLFEGPAREAFRGASGADDATWARGRGWAVSISLACLASSADNPLIARMGRRGVDALLAEHPLGG